MSTIPSQERPSAAPGTAGHETQLWLLRAAKVIVLFIYAFVLVNLVMLTLGFVLRLFGASTEAEFTRWVYRSVDRIMEPFRGMFPSQQLSDRSVIDVSLLFAIIVYAIVGIALHALVTWLTEKLVEHRRRQRRTTDASAAHTGDQPAQPPRPGATAPGPAPPPGATAYRSGPDPSW